MTTGIASPIVFPAAGIFYPSFEPQHCVFPTAVDRDELFTPWIQFKLAEVSYYDEETTWHWDVLAWCIEHINCWTERVELRIYHGDMSPEDAYVIKSWGRDEISAGQTLVWTTPSPITIQTLVGSITESQTIKVGFVIHILVRYNSYGWWESWPWHNRYDPWDYLWLWVDDDTDVLEYLVSVSVPEPPPEYPNTVFREDLCYFPTYVKVDEPFSPVLVIENSGVAGAFYIAYWYLGEWYELLRSTIAEGEVYTHLIDPIVITDLIGLVEESLLADIRFYTGYLEAGVDPMETITGMFPASVYVEVEVPPPPPPPPPVEVSWMPLAGAAALLIGGGVLLWPREGE